MRVGDFYRAFALTARPAEQVDGVFAREASKLLVELEMRLDVPLRSLLEPSDLAEEQPGATRS